MIRFQNGDSDVFSEFYELTKRYVYSTIRGIVPSNVNDLVQDVYLKAYMELKNIDNPMVAVKWIDKIAYRTALNYKNTAYKKHEQFNHIMTGGVIYDKSPKSISNAWEHIIAGAVIEWLAGGIFRFHDLRHYAAAWWLTVLHYDIQTCMRYGGWTEVQTLTKIDTYVLSDAKAHAAENVEKYGNEYLTEAGL